MSNIVTFLLLRRGGVLSSFPTSRFSLVKRNASSTVTRLFSIVVNMLYARACVRYVFSTNAPLGTTSNYFVTTLVIVPVKLPSMTINVCVRTTRPKALPVLILPAFLIGRIPILVNNLTVDNVVLSLLKDVKKLSLNVNAVVSRSVLSPLLGVASSEGLLHLAGLAILTIVVLTSLVTVVGEKARVLF